MKNIKYVGYLYSSQTRCMPIFGGNLEDIQKTIDIELNKQEFKDIDDMEGLHCAVYEIKKEIKIKETHKLNFKIDNDSN